VIVPISDCFGGSILSFRSTDGGNSWSRTLVAAQIFSSSEPGGLRSSALPSAESDASGRVYVAWQDCRFEPSCATNDIVLITSPDGLTWSAVQRIPIDAIGTTTDHFIPGLAVDRSTSGSHAHLALALYYIPNALIGAGSCTTTGANACQLDVGFVSSLNGGASWSAKEQLGGAMNIAWLPNTTLGYMVGDYISTSIIAGTNLASPVFAGANRPVGSVFDEAMYTSTDEMALITGGTQVPDGVPVATSSRPSGSAAPLRLTAN
jgi:hypothetical protein